MKTCSHCSGQMLPERDFVLGDSFTVEYECLQCGRAEQRELPLPTQQQMAFETRRSRRRSPTFGGIKL